MNAAPYVGRVGGLAVALGVGAAVATGHGVAWAETSSSSSSASPSSSGSPGSSSTSSPASSGSDSAPDTSGSVEPSVSSPTTDSKPDNTGGATATGSDGSADDSSALSTGTSSSGPLSSESSSTVSESGPPVVVRFSGAPHTSIHGTGDSSAGADSGPDATTAPAPETPEPTPAKETTASKGTTPVSTSGTDWSSTAPAPIAKKPKRLSLDTTARPSGVADKPSAAQSEASSPVEAAPSGPVVNDAPVTGAAVQRAAVSPPALTASTDAPQQAFVAPQAKPARPSAPAAPASDGTAVVSNVLAGVGMAPLATNSPTAPVQSPALWAVCAWCRRQNEKSLAGEPAMARTEAAPSPTSLMLASTDTGAGEPMMALAAVANEPPATLDVADSPAAAAAVAAPPAFVQVKAATPQTNQSSVAVTYTSAQVAGNTNILAIGWNNATSNITSVTDSATLSDPVVTGGQVQTFTLWPDTATPALIADTDLASVELGVRFRSNVAGAVTGLRFYKSATNTDTHTGALWAADGTKLASLTFANETASGWQTANFATPVQIEANKTYTASYHAPNGRYSFTGEYFTAPITSGVLTAFTELNGVYRYGATAGFPTNSWRSTNYWVSPIVAAVPSPTPPVPPQPPASGLPPLWNASPPSGVSLAPSGPPSGTLGQFDYATLATNELWDNFNGAAGSNPDSRLWEEDFINQGGQQVYDPARTFLDGAGNLVFEALRLGPVNYRSGRLTSRTKFNMQYGWLAARIKFPSDPGFVPAWWALQVGYNTGAPYGEIDMMEYFGRATQYNVHLLFGDEADPLEAARRVPASHGGDASLDFHTYWMQWEPERIRIGVDDLMVADWTAQALSNPAAWRAVQQPHYYIWNFAVHPDWLPEPAATSFPARMLTDWIWYKPLALL